MKGGIESLVWIDEENGQQYVCSLKNFDKHSFEELSEEEKRKCANVNQIVGTERW